MARPTTRSTVATTEEPVVAAPEEGDPIAPRTPYIEVAKDEKGRWHWCLWSANGRMLATNPNPYERRAECTGAVETMMKCFEKRVNILVRSN